MYSESAPWIYLHIKPAEQSYDWIIPKCHIDHINYCNALCETNGFKELDKISREIKSQCHIYLMGTGNIF